MIRFFTLLITFTLFISCEETIILKNEKKDIQKADSCTVLFYTYLSQKDISSIYKISDKTLSKEIIQKAVLINDSINGKIINVDLIKIETEFYKNNDKTKTTYSINTKVTYDKGIQEEKLTFLKLNDNDILLKQYEFIK